MNRPEPHSFYKRATILLGSGLLVALCLHLSAGQALETKATDLAIAIRNQIFSTRESSENLVFAAIDANSLRPGASPHSFPWNQGGWLTRENWSLGLQLFKEYYRPRVVAYHLRFPEIAHAPIVTSEDTQERLKLIQDLEKVGALEFQQRLWELAQLREQQIAAPIPVFGFDISSGFGGSLSPMEAAAQTLQAQSIFEAIRLPEGAVLGSFQKEPIMIGAASPRFPGEEILQAPILLGSFDFPRDFDGKIRRIPLVQACRFASMPNRTIYLPGFPLSVLLAHLEISPKQLSPFGGAKPTIEVIPGELVRIETMSSRWEIPIDENGALRLNPRCKTPLMLSYVQLLDDGLFAAGRAVQPRPSALQDKIVFIAPTFSEGSPLPEETIAAWTAINQILRRDPLQTLPVWIQGFLMVIISLLTLLALTLVRVSKTRYAVIGSALAYFLVVGSAFFLKGWMLPTIFPFFWFVLIFGFEYYVVPPPVVETPAAPPPEPVAPATPVTGFRLRKSGTEIPPAVLRGIQAEALILASGWSGLTELSQSAEPMAVAHLLRQFQSRLHDKIKATPGASELLDGERLLISWGALDQSDQHPLAACRMALAQFEIIEALRPTTPLLREFPIQLQSALHRGTVTAGQLGPENRVGILGPGVDFVWRLQSLNRTYGTSILLTDSLFNDVQDEIVVRVVDRVMFHGKLETLYELISLVSPRSEPPAWIASYHEALSLYWERQWDQAIARFQAIQKLRPEGDSVSLLMIQRSQFFRQNPPSNTWQGEPPT